MIKWSQKHLRLLGYRLQSRRQEKGIKQEYVAKQLDVSKSYVSKIENGQVSVTLITLMQYCTIVGISVLDELSEVIEIVEKLG